MTGYSFSGKTGKVSWTGASRAMDSCSASCMIATAAIGFEIEAMR